MPRSPAALLLLLAPLSGCGEGDHTHSTGSAAEQAQASWFPAAPFCDDIRLPEASQARSWQPPAEGPVPVIEILRDGTWILDGVLVEGGEDARRETLASRLGQEARRMPREHLVPDLEASRQIPSNPAFVRVDCEAPWESLRQVIEACHHWHTQISRVELQVRAQDPSELRTLTLPMARDFGTLCLSGGAWTWSWLVAEAGSELHRGLMPREKAPSPFAFLVADYVRDQAEDQITSEYFDSLPEIAVRLEEALRTSWGEVSLDLPRDAPARMAIAALDLGTSVGVKLWGFPSLPDAPERTW